MKDARFSRPSHQIRIHSQHSREDFFISSSGPNCITFSTAGGGKKSRGGGGRGGRQASRSLCFFHPTNIGSVKLQCKATDSLLSRDAMVAPSRTPGASRNRAPAPEPSHCSKMLERKDTFPANLSLSFFNLSKMMFLLYYRAA